MADDDLDAFFDDVENAVKEVEKSTDVNDDPATVGAAAATEESTVAAKSSAATTTTTALNGDNENNEQQQRPAKRVKVSSAVAASSAPIKNIIASSVPVVSIVAPPLPAGPPPVAAATSSNITTIPPPPPIHGISGTNNNPQSQQPPLPPPLPPNTETDGRTHVRSAAGQTWSDPTLAQWPANDFRLFVGNLAKDLKQHHLEQHFQKYPSFAMARIMYNKADGKSRGYGFVSLLDPKDCARAIREMDQSWLGSRPIKVKLSEWKDREWKEVKKRGKMDKRKKKHFGL